MWSLLSAAFSREQDALNINGTQDGGLWEKKCNLIKKKERRNEGRKVGKKERRDLRKTRG